MNTRERGSVLLVVLVLAGALAASAATLAMQVEQTALELAARRDVLCARFAALSGLAIGNPAIDPITAARLVNERVRRIELMRYYKRPGWCVLRSRATCGGAERTLEKTLQETACAEASDQP